MRRICCCLLIFLSISFNACQDAASGTEALKKEVLRIHDEVMPKVHDIHKFTKQLEDQLKTDSLAAGDQNKVQGVIDQLNAADKAMWDWMEGYKDLDETQPKEVYMQALQKEKEKISKVSELMLSSIKEAKTLLDSK